MRASGHMADSILGLKYRSIKEYSRRENIDIGSRFAPTYINIYPFRASRHDSASHCHLGVKLEMPRTENGARHVFQ